jgi:translation initiation factor 3 subunit G
MAAAQQKIRWGELEEDDGGDLDFLLPPRVVIGPDASGVKKVIEYRFDDDGNKVKVTTTTRVRKLAKTNLSKSAIERRSWPKFGDALKEDAASRLTMVSTEEILLERPRAPGPRPRSISFESIIWLKCIGETQIGLSILSMLRSGTWWPGFLF